MQFIINGKKIYDINPPFSEVGEIIQVGAVQSIIINEVIDENKTNRNRRGRVPKLRPDILGTGGEAGNLSERVQPEVS